MDSPSISWTDEQVRRFWDHASLAPESYASFLVGRNIARRLKRHLGHARTVLDFGCGPGFLIPHLAAYGARVSGCEVSPDSMAHGRSHLDDLSGFDGIFATADLLAAHKTFDLVISVEVIEHLQDAVLDGALDAMRALLKPGGLLVLTTPNDEDLSQSMVLCPNCAAQFHRWQHVRSWSAATLTAILEKRGFKVIAAEEDDFAFPPGPLFALARFARDRIAGKRKRPQLLVQAIRTPS